MNRVKAAIEWLCDRKTDLMDLSMIWFVTSCSLFLAALATIAITTAVNDPQCSKCRCESHAVPVEQVEAHAQ